MKEEILENIYNSKRNVIIDGDMSVGKTKKLGFNFVSKIINENENLFILDSREEYLQRYYDELKNKNYNIVILNTKDFSKSEGYNILNYPYLLYKNNEEDKAIKYLDKISEEIFLSDFNTNADPYWANSARDLFTGVTLALFEDAKEEEINLCSINSVINESDSKVNYVAEYLRTKDSKDLAYVYASSVVFSPFETLGGVISTAKQKLTPLVSKNILNSFTSKTTFDYNEFLTKPTAIFFINNEMDTSLSSLVSIFISQLYEILIDNNCENKFNFVLDNFDTVNKINGLKGMLSSSISNNIKFYIMTRDKNNLENIYSDYINKLSNLVTITEKNILVNINNEKTEITNEGCDTQKIISNVDYPSLTKKDVNIFNLKRYVLENIKVDDYN